jgi:hypothetical protein
MLAMPRTSDQGALDADCLSLGSNASSDTRVPPLRSANLEMSRFRSVNHATYFKGASNSASKDLPVSVILYWQRQLNPTCSKRAHLC